MPSALGVLVPRLPATTEIVRPEDRPFGRAALALGDRPIVFVDQVDQGVACGFVARPGRWEPVHDVPLAAAYDRFPSQSRPDEYARLLAGLGQVPVANPPALADLCRDKLGSQQVLVDHGVPMPEVEGDPSRFAARLAEWGAGFLKPRYGSFGRGIVRVTPGDDLPSEVEGAVPGTVDPSILQRALPPPAGWAGMCSRILVQRVDADEWYVEAPVVRRSRTDVVVNASRGSEVVLLADAAPDLYAAVVDVGLAAARALAAEPGGGLLVEVGADVVIDADGAAWLVEVNGRPRGRLEVMALQDAVRWHTAHVDACARPMRYLLDRYVRDGGNGADRAI